MGGTRIRPWGGSIGMGTTRERGEEGCAVLWVGLWAFLRNECLFKGGGRVGQGSQRGAWISSSLQVKHKYCTGARSYLCTVPDQVSRGPTSRRKCFLAFDSGYFLDFFAWMTRARRATAGRSTTLGRPSTETSNGGCEPHAARTEARGVDPERPRLAIGYPLRRTPEPAR